MNVFPRETFTAALKRGDGWSFATFFLSDKVLGFCLRKDSKDTEIIPLSDLRFSETKNLLQITFSSCKTETPPTKLQVKFQEEKTFLKISRILADLMAQIESFNVPSESMSQKSSSTNSVQEKSSPSCIFISNSEEESWFLTGFLANLIVGKKLLLKKVLFYLIAFLFFDLSFFETTFSELIFCSSMRVLLIFVILLTLNVKFGIVVNFRVQRTMPDNKDSSVVFFNKYLEVFRKSMDSLGVKIQSIEETSTSFELSSKSAELKVHCSNGKLSTKYRGNSFLLAKKLESTAYFESLGELLISKAKSAQEESDKQSSALKDAERKKSEENKEATLIENLFSQKKEEFFRNFDSNDWIEEEKGESFTIWKRDDPSFVQRKCECTFNLSLETFARIMKDPSTTSKLNPFVKSQEIIESISSNRSIVRVVVDCPFPFSNREFVDYFFTSSEEKKFFVLIFQAPDSKVSTSKKFVRGVNELAGWMAEDVGDGKLRVKFFTKSDAKLSMLPKKVVEMGAKSAGRAPLVLRELAAKA